jgi:Protein of unknown function (DUF3726)
VRELSCNEVESLALKVGRGAGFSWGLADEIGRGALALARGGGPWAEALLALARDAGNWRAPSSLRVQGWLERRDEVDAASPLCPLRVAALLIDDPSILNAGPLRIANVGLPLWIAALFAGSGLGKEFELDWPGASADASMTPAADVTIARRSAFRAPVPPLRRMLADDAALAALGAVASLVYVPASEGSRAQGAGGGSVDDE